MSWHAATLGEIAERDGGLIQTGPFGSQLHQSDYVPDGIPVIMPKDISDGRVDSASVKRVSEETAGRLSRHQLRPKTIVLPRRGDITKRAFVRDDQTGWLCGTGCLQIALKGGHVLPKFLYYYMEQQEVTRWLEQHAVGTTMLNLSAGIVTKLPLKYPAPTVQYRIADILSAYDDLIENNRRRMALLEEAARQLYREWFVRLRFPGHEHTRIIDGVPEGWADVSASEIFDLNPKEKIEKNTVATYVPMSSLSETGMTVKRQDFEERTSHTSIRFRNGDTLFARITPSLENGKTGFTDFLGEKDVACGSTEIIVLRGTVVSPYFTYCLARTYDFRENAIKSMIGSSGRQRVQNSCFDKFRLPLPPKMLRDEFDRATASCFQQIKNFADQNQRLAKARDLLLPRLMSGEIAV